MTLNLVRKAVVTIALGLACLVSAPTVAQTIGNDASARQILVLTQLPPPHHRLDSTYGGGYSDGQERIARRRLARQIARRHGLSLANDWPLPLIGLDCFVMTVPDGQSLDEAIRQMSSDHDVAFAEPMQLYNAKGRSISYNDPLLPAQPMSPTWQLQSLHQLSTGRGVRVAIVDSGIESTHPDLSGQISVNLNFVDGSPFVPERHGTAIAGVIAAKAGNGLGVVGVAPGARLQGLRACWQRSAPEADTVCDTLSLAKALHYAIDHGAQVINMSLAGPRAELLDRLLSVALARRIDVVAAFDPSLPGGGFPASHHGVVAVADGATLRLPAGVYAAQGQDVLTTLPGGHWSLVSGSSYAAAQVSGLLALVRAKNAAADPVSALVVARSRGGEINACATLLGITTPCDCACARMAQAATAVSR